MRKVFLFVFLFLFSCSDLDQEGQLSKMEALQSTLSNSSDKFKQIYVDSLYEMGNRSSELERSVKQHYFSDTVDMALGKRMDDYKRMRRMLKPLGNAGSRLKKSYTEEKKQLLLLQSDIKNGFGERNRYDEFIAFEAQKIDRIVLLQKEYKKLKLDAFTLYEKHHEFLVLFVRQLIDSKQ